MRSFDKISEKDWKYLRKLQSIIIERFCEQTISKVQNIISLNGEKSHLKKYQLIHLYLDKREKMLVENLNDFRRSNAILKIFNIKNLGWFTEEEFDGFSDEIKKVYKDE